MLFGGDGIPEDKKESLKYFELAEKNGHADAQYMCWAILYKGDGATQDQCLDSAYLEMAAKSRNPKSIKALKAWASYKYSTVNGKT